MPSDLGLNHHLGSKLLNFSQAMAPENETERMKWILILAKTVGAYIVKPLKSLVAPAIQTDSEASNSISYGIFPVA